MNELIAFINSISILDSATEEAVYSCFKKESFKNNDFIIKQDKICSKIYFIKSGLVRRFIRNDSEELTQWIYFDGQFITSLTSFFEQKASFENFQACEDTLVYCLSFSDEQILLEYPLFAKFHLKLLRLYLSKLNEFHHHYKLMNAEEKYTYLMNYFPQIILRAKLKHVASLIGVSPETLSRIRSSIN